MIMISMMFIHVIYIYIHMIMTVMLYNYICCVMLYNAL